MIVAIAHLSHPRGATKMREPRVPGQAAGPARAGDKLRNVRISVFVSRKSRAHGGRA
jgi:hypothetical protein